MHPEMVLATAQAGRGLGGLLGGMGGAGFDALTFGAPVYLAAAYFFIFWDRRSDDSENKEDGQVGLKLGLFTLVIAALGVVMAGLSNTIDFLLAGAKPSAQIKAALASLIAGGAVIGAVLFMFVPRTNTKDFNKAERFAWGFVAVLTGLMTILALKMFLMALFTGAPWKHGSSAGLAELAVAGGVFYFALSKFGGLSGWTAPAKAPSMPAGFGAQPQPGMPQQPGVPQQQAYPGAPQTAPQQAPQGYPPQQSGGVPPAGGGYPPQGGGLPPPAGGGYPPQGGGGYPPR